jgi:hypothetical protein
MLTLPLSEVQLGCNYVIKNEAYDVILRNWRIKLCIKKSDDLEKEQLGKMIEEQFNREEYVYYE